MTEAGVYLQIRDREIIEVLRERVQREAQPSLSPRRNLGPVYVSDPPAGTRRRRKRVAEFSRQF